MDYMFWCFTIEALPFLSLSFTLTPSHFESYRCFYLYGIFGRCTGSIWMCDDGVRVAKRIRGKKSSGANKIDRCQNKNKVHALTFEAIDVENAKEMMFMCAIFGSDTASSLYCTSCVHRAHNST